MSFWQALRKQRCFTERTASGGRSPQNRQDGQHAPVGAGIGVEP